jgi:dihydroxy-acid dehydratase
LRIGRAIAHVAPESFGGGLLALVKDGDIIELDVLGRRPHLDSPTLASRAEPEIH